MLEIFDDAESISTIKKHDSNIVTANFFEFYLLKFQEILTLETIAPPLFRLVLMQTVVVVQMIWIDLQVVVWLFMKWSSEVDV